jgi:hypothetical protein
MKINVFAMAHLTFAFTSESMMGLIYKAITRSFPSGLACLVVEALQPYNSSLFDIFRSEVFSFYGVVVGSRFPISFQSRFRLVMPDMAVLISREAFFGNHDLGVES